MAQLSDQLREELYIEANKIVLKDCKIFSDNFSQEIIKKTIPLIHELHCTPGQIIYMQGDKTDPTIYFIEKGEVKEFFSRK